MSRFTLLTSGVIVSMFEHVNGRPFASNAASYESSRSATPSAWDDAAVDQFRSVCAFFPLALFFLEVPSSSEAGRIRHELNTEKELRHSQPRWLTCSRVRSFTKLCSFRSCLCISSVDYMVSSSVLPLDRGSILCQCFLYSSADFCLCPSS